MGRFFSEYEVHVVPDRRWQLGDFQRCAERDKEACAEMVEQIRRHVDNVGAAAVVGVAPVCEHCGRMWTEENPRYNGGCCERDLAAATPEDYRAVEGVDLVPALADAPLRIETEGEVICR